MSIARNFVTVGGTVACALGIGFMMQSGSPSSAGNQRLASADPEAEVIAGLRGVVLTSSSPIEGAMPQENSLNTISSATFAAPGETRICSLDARATAAPMASANLIVEAPCLAEQQVEIHHSGLTFTEMTDAEGRLDITIPALSEYAIFLVSFENHKGAVATTHVKDLGNYDRVALQWNGTTDLQIHALEFGASYGEHGHVWANPNAQGLGRVVQLGNIGAPAAQAVEVYSVPTQDVDQSGTVALTVETEVTDANCGREIVVHSLELRADRRLTSREMKVGMPECSAAGEFLVLNNLFKDLKIASN
ncbi:MAG: hypothetical protein ACR2O2_06955 [Ruegeria sp.]